MWPRLLWTPIIKWVWLAGVAKAAVYMVLICEVGVVNATNDDSIISLSNVDDFSTYTLIFY